MAGQNIDLSQFDDITKFLDDLGSLGNYANPLLRRAANAGAEIIKEDAAERTRRSSVSKQHLQDNVLVRPASVTKDGRVVAKIGFRKGFFYSNPLQAGHLIRTRKGIRVVRPYPALEPAWESKRVEATAEMVEAIRAGMPEVLRRIAEKRVKNVK